MSKCNKCDKEPCECNKNKYKEIALFICGILGLCVLAWLYSN